ncbi:TraM recognition domain-containing protein [Pseudoxanthomonas winnipegensis]|uniref:TraD/TraG TraM recognition site domain-containing protein n=1 Tax=Pseudoxanthomonas winnipegensis TaxID=2480810 RepID=A0A4Q8M2U8_9GAMM|nr:TraM recognition domain-containing protein [Pseudoxanthomonas winnipegensis]TAA41527.1 hypothetical protein EA655_11335 [Pseudoxanthomonas winnipegensis]
MKLSIFTVGDFIDGITAKRKGRPTTTTTQVIGTTSLKRYKRLMDRADLRVPSRYLANVLDGDEKELSQLGAQKNDSGKWEAPEGADLEPFKKWWPLKPIDLDDQNSSYSRTSDGYAWEGFVGTDDMNGGEDSSATPILYGMFPVLAAITMFLLLQPFGLVKFFSVIPMLLLIPNMIALSQARASLFEPFKVAFIGYCLPLMTVMAMAGINAASLNLTGAAGDFANTFISGGSMLTLLMGAGSTALLGLFGLYVLFEIGFGGHDSIIGGLQASIQRGFKTFGWVALTLAAFTLFPAIAKDILGLIPWLMIKLHITPVKIYTINSELVACIRPAMAFMLASSLPMFYTEKKHRERGIELDQQSKASPGANQEKDLMRDKEIKEGQAIRAVNDPTPLVVFGRAYGDLAAIKYQYAPDAGKLMVASQNDLMTHSIAFGRTGSGKSTSLARPLIVQIARNSILYPAYKMGMLVTCGKGALPAEVADALDYLIKAGMAVSPTEGHTAKSFADVMNKIGDTGEAPKDPFWRDAASNHIYNVAVIWEALCEQERTKHLIMAEEMSKLDRQISYHSTQVTRLNFAERGSEEHKKFVEELNSMRKRRYFFADELKRGPTWEWSFFCFNKLISATNRTKFNPATEQHGPVEEIQNVFKFLGMIVGGVQDTMFPAHPASKDSGSALITALEYLTNDWYPMPDQTRKSVYANITQRLNPLLQSDTLVDEHGTKWMALTKGVDITDCLRGKRLGIDLHFDVHGKVAPIVTRMLINRVYKDVRKRATFVQQGGWDKCLNDPTLKDATRCMLVMDEAQLLLGQDEKEMAPTCRQFGLGFNLLTQSYEGLFAALGNEKDVNAFINNFQNIWCTEASEETYAWFSKKIGQARLLTYDQDQRGINYAAGYDTYRNSVLNMRNHPNAPFLKRLKGLGFAKVVSHQGRFSIANRWKRDAGISDGREVSDDTYFQTRLLAKSSGHMDVREVVSVAEMEKTLNGSSGARALVYINRSNTRRVDFIKTLRVDQKDVKGFMSDLHRPIEKTFN